MIQEFDVYLAFRRAQGRFYNRGFRMPKDWDLFFKEMKENQRKNLTLLSTFLNTKWNIIDINIYFDVGFELYQKTFSYNKFFDPKVLKHYINRDKIKKRDETNTEEDLKNSLKHIRSLLPDSQDYSDLLYKYSKMQVNNITLPVQDYLNNKIGKYFLTHLIKSGYVKLTQEENILCPLITENYREYINQIQEYRKSI